MQDFTELAVPGVRQLTPYKPGKPISELQRELGISEAHKLASNENPLGPSPAAVEAMKDVLAGLNRYPDAGGFELKTALSEQLGVERDQLTLGNGSNDVLDLLGRVFLGPGRAAVYSRHAFAVYALTTQACGAEARVAEPTGPDSGMPYGHDLDAMQALIDERTRLVFIANPNNPTGTWLKRDALEAFLEAVPEDVVVVLDEAYAEYVEDPEYPDGVAWIERFPNLVVCRTFSKIHGLAGARVGYAVSHPQVADLLNRVRHPFNVGTLGQAGALAALRDQGHVRRSRELNAAGRAELEEGLANLGLPTLPSATNFVTAEVGEQAASIYQRLLERGYIVRPLEGDGLPHHLRISVGTETENRGLLAALGEVLENA